MLSGVLLMCYVFGPVCSAQYGQTALVFASFSGYMDVVELLLRNNANADVQTKVSETRIAV